jgi:hypothetical protein
MTLLANLSPTQRAQVAVVFAHDEYFGKNPAWYDYDFDPALAWGVVRIRLPEFVQKRAVTRPHRQLPCSLAAQPYSGPLSPELQVRRELAVRVLARWILTIQNKEQVCPQP